MYHKNTSYSEQTINSSESIKRVASGKYTFDDIENIYLGLMKRFIFNPTIKNNEEWYKFQLKYVPFKKQELSPQFIENMLQMLDTLIERKDYQTFNIVQTRVISFLSTVIDNNTCIKVLEKNISFLANESRYSKKVKEYQKDLIGLKKFVEFEKEFDRKQIHSSQVSQQEIKISQTLDEISDTLLDLDLFFKNNFLMRLDQEDVRDIIND